MAIGILAVGGLSIPAAQAQTQWQLDVTNRGQKAITLVEMTQPNRLSEWRSLVASSLASGTTVRNRWSYQGASAACNYKLRFTFSDSSMLTLPALDYCRSVQVSINDGQFKVVGAQIQPIGPTTSKPTSQPVTLPTTVASSTPIAANLASRDQEMLTAHNTWRRRVGVPNLRWSSQLASYAQEWANNLARSNRLAHRSNNKYGENLAWASGQQLSPTQVVQMWGNESQDYNYASNSCRSGKVCGHYTQIVWKNSTEVGCGMARSGNQEFWVCNYNPPGNYIGQKPY